MQHRKMAVLHFRSQRRFPKPVLCIPALISRSYILDLCANATMIGTLCEAGYDVYLLDWGLPGDEDAATTLEQLICEYIEAAVTRVRETSGSKKLSVLGYCMGGTLCGFVERVQQTLQAQ